MSDFPTSHFFQLPFPTTRKTYFVKFHFRPHIFKLSKYLFSDWILVWNAKNQSRQVVPYAKIARGLNQFAFRINNKNQVVCGINIEKVRIGQNTLNDTLRPNHGYVGQKNKNEELNFQTGPIKMNFGRKRLFNIKSRDPRTRTDWSRTWTKKWFLDQFGSPWFPDQRPVPWS